MQTYTVVLLPPLEALILEHPVHRKHVVDVLAKDEVSALVQARKEVANLGDYAADGFIPIVIVPKALNLAFRNLAFRRDKSDTSGVLSICRQGT